LAGKLAEYAWMDLSNDLAHPPETPPSPPRMDRSRRVLWVIGLLAALAITALAFGAYRQPELLLNILGLRYCG
jgi:predicted cobalt transporter CbtA